MKIWIKILLVVVVLGLLVFVYRKFLYFPHAKITGYGTGRDITWTNKSDVVRSIIRRSGTGTESGTYGQGYMYEVQYLPNEQFRFMVYKLGQKAAPVVDNIYSFNNPPLYLTK